MLRAYRAEGQNSPSKAPFLFLLLLLSRLHLMLRKKKKKKDTGFIFSLPSLDKHQKLSVHSSYDFLCLTELYRFSFLSLIFKADTNIFCFPSVKNIKKDFQHEIHAGLLSSLSLSLRNAQFIRPNGECELCQSGLRFLRPGPPPIPALRLSVPQQ